MNLGVMFFEVAMVKKLLGADSGSLMKCPMQPCWGIQRFSDNFQPVTNTPYTKYTIHRMCSGAKDQQHRPCRRQPGLGGCIQAKHVRQRSGSL